MGKNIKTHKMVRILLLTCDFPPNRGGISTHLYNLYSLIKTKYYINVLVLGIDGENTDSIYYKNVLKTNYLIEIMKILSNKHYDIIIIGTMYPLGWILRGLNINSKICYFIYGSEIIYKKTFIPIPSPKLILRTADYIVSISHYTKSLIEYESSVYYPLIDFKSPLLDANNKNKYYIIGTLGRIEKHKNHIAIISHFEVLRKKVFDKTKHDVIYRIAGKGNNEDFLKNYIKKHGISNIEFLGELNDKNKEIFFKSIDLFVMPSIKTDKAVEGFGIVVQEAALYSKPTIGYNSGGLKESIIDNDCLIEEGNEQLLINGIAELLSNNELRIKKGKEFKNRAKRFLINDNRLIEFENILNIGGGGRI